MKTYILAFSICSAITGFCDTTRTVETNFNSWSECVRHGGAIIVDFSIEMQEHVDKNHLYISYFCNENIINTTTTPSKHIKEKI